MPQRLPRLAELGLFKDGPWEVISMQETSGEHGFRRVGGERGGGETLASRVEMVGSIFHVVAVMIKMRPKTLEQLEPDISLYHFIPSMEPRAATG